MDGAARPVMCGWGQPHLHHCFSLALVCSETLKVITQSLVPMHGLSFIRKFSTQPRVPELEE